MICSNCQKEVNSKYCPNCGQEAGIKRIDGQYLKEELGHLFHFEKGNTIHYKSIDVQTGKEHQKLLDK